MNPASAIDLPRAEHLLREALAIDRHRLSEFAVWWIEEYCHAGACLRALESFAHEVETGAYAPSVMAGEALRHAALALGVAPPPMQARPAPRGRRGLAQAQ